jgi:hypothetical protein
LFHRCEEGVHVDMENGSGGGYRRFFVCRFHCSMRATPQQCIMRQGTCFFYRSPNNALKNKQLRATIASVSRDPCTPVRLAPDLIHKNVR